MLSLALKSGVLGTIATAESSLKRGYEISRQRGSITPDFRINLVNFFKAINPQMRNSFLRLSLVAVPAINFFAKSGTPPWQILLSLNVWCRLLKLPDGAAPSDDMFADALAEDEAVASLLSKYDSFIPHIRALSIIDSRDILTRQYIDSWNKLPFPKGSLESLGDALELEKAFLIPWLKIRAESLLPYRNLINACKLLNLEGISLHSISASALLRKSDEFFENLKQRIHKALDVLLPPAFSLQDTEKLVMAITPSPSDKDMELLHKEMTDLESGNIQPSQSWLLQWILPAIKGERVPSYEDIDELQEQTGIEFQYSPKFFGGILQNAYRLDPERMAGGQADGITAASDLPDERSRTDKKIQETDIHEVKITEQNEPAENSGDTPQPGAMSGASSDWQGVREGSAPISDMAQMDVSVAEDVFAENEMQGSGDRKTHLKSVHIASGSVSKKPAKPEKNEESNEAEETKADSLESACSDVGEETVFQAENGETEINYQRFAVEHLPEDMKPRIITSPSAAGQADPLNASQTAGSIPAKAGDLKSITDLRKNKSKSNEFIFTPDISSADMQKMGPLGGLENSISGRFQPFICDIEDDYAGNLEEYAERTGEAEKVVKKSKTSSMNRIYEAIKSVIDLQKPKAETSPEPQEIESLYHELLQHIQPEAIYWLARTLGEKAPLPGWLAELLYFGSQLDHSNIEIEPVIHNLVNIALTKHQDLDEYQSLLMLAALLRPALITPVKSMSTIFSTLAGRLNGYGLTNIIKGLEAFVSHEIPVSEAIITGKTREQINIIVHERLKRKTQDLLKRMSTPSFGFVPAARICKKIFGENGEIGNLLNQCLADKSKDLKEYVSGLMNTNNRADFWNPILDNAKISRYNRKIDGKYRQKIASYIDAALDLLIEWNDYFTENSGGGTNTSYQEKFFNEICGEQYSERLNTSLEGMWLLSVVGKLKNCKPIEDPNNPEEKIKLWPLRLGSASLHTDPVFDEGSLYKELKEQKYNDMPTVAANLRIHMANGHISAVKRFFALYPAIRYVDPDVRVYDSWLPDLGKVGSVSLEKLEEVSSSIWNDHYNDRRNEVLAYINDCIFRGAIRDDQSIQANTILAGIHQDILPTTDKPGVISKLDDLNGMLQEWDMAMLHEVENRLQKLQEESDRDDVHAFLDKIKKEVSETRLYGVAWDRIASLEDILVSRSNQIPVFESRTTSRKAAATDFYRKLKNNEIHEEMVHSKEWRDALDLRKKDLSGSRFLGVITELLRWFGFTLDQTEKPEYVYSSGAPVFWRVNKFRMSIKSPLPLWGSQSGNNHIIALGWGKVTPWEINNLMTSDHIHESNAVTLICFCPLSWEERRQIIQASTNWPVFPLIIDSNVFNYLTSCEKKDRSRLLFEVALAGANYNPYIPDASGFVPKEMFYGRSKEKSNVIDINGTCVIYGGRQLGKSALLQQIKTDYDKNQEQIVLCVILGKSESSLLDKLITECVNRKIIRPETRRNTFDRNVMSWLQEDKSRRIIVLLDECDNALEKDSERNFEEVELYRNLMQTSERRFKVVLTGLHSVQRFSHFPNSPLFHFGNPVCIGPLDKNAAYDLMTVPMATLGIEFESPQLVQMALNYCSYQPRLIQMFCSELLDAIQKNPDRDPCIQIDKANILAVYDSQNLKKKIQECFSMTLDLDPRYFVIAYVMALYTDEGISISNLQSELQKSWPAAFKRCDLEILRSLLHEMEGLNLVICLSGAYRLRTPNITELLGGVDNIILELEQKKEQDYILPNDPDELRIEGADVFVASQYNLLADKASRLYWVSGSKSLGLDAVPDALEKIARDNASGRSIPCVRLDGMTVKEAMSSLSHGYDKVRSGGLIVWISSREFPFIAGFMESSQKWLATLRSDKKFIKIVCVVWPRELFSFIRDGIRSLYSSLELPLLPWSLTGLEDRCRDKELPTSYATGIMQQTNGWYCLVPRDMKDNLGDISLLQSETREIISEFNGLRAIVEQFYMLDEKIPAQDVQVLMPESMEEEYFLQCMEFLRSLHLVREKDAKLFLDEAAFPRQEANA